jgi:hypothetical protein
MPQFVAQILSLDGDVLLSNVDISIDVSQQGMEWRGNFDLPPTSTFDPNSLPRRKMGIFHASGKLVNSLSGSIASMVRRRRSSAVRQ